MKLYRGKLKAALHEAGLIDEVDPQVWNKPWVVDVQSVGNGQSTLKYLASYVFRVAISDRRIQSCENGRVTFRYKPSGERWERPLPLDAMEFLRRFLQHVLPKGFQKVRHHGFLHHNSNHSIEDLRLMIRASQGENHYLEPTTSQEETPGPKGLRCDACGERLVWLAFVAPANLIAPPPTPLLGSNTAPTAL